MVHLAEGTTGVQTANRGWMRARRRILAGILIAGAVSLAGCVPPTSSSSTGSGARTTEPAETFVAVEEAEPAFSKAALPWPDHGATWVGAGGGSGCLELSVPSGDSAYYVKLKSGSTTVWDSFMRPGSTSSWAVPVGTYELSYGAGEEWFGPDDAFGPYGAYAEASEIFTFDQSSCWSVELILQVGGNLGTSGIDYTAF